jgi:hypothetical protein
VVDYDVNVLFRIPMGNFIGVNGERLINKAELRVKGICDELSKTYCGAGLDSGVGEDEPCVLKDSALLMTVESYHLDLGLVNDASTSV